jgi:hypothetical protein
MKKIFLGLGAAVILYLGVSWGYYFFYPGASQKIDEKHRVERIEDSIAENVDRIEDSIAENQKAINEKAEELKRDHESMAKVITKDYVSEKLKFPEEADFELLSTTVQRNEKGLYNVRGIVTAKNAFGVKTKYSYNCSLQYLGGNDAEPTNWNLVALTIN